MAGANPARTGYTVLPGPMPVAADKELAASWTYHAPLSDSRNYTLCSAPVIDSAGNVYFTTSIEVISLTAKGVQRWVVHIDQLDAGSYLPSYSDALLTADNLLIVTNGFGGLWALTSDGEIAWRLEDFGNYGAQLAVSGNRLYLAQNRTLYAITDSGEMLWDLELPVSIEDKTAPAVAADGTLLLRDTDGSFLAVSSSGTIRWSYPAKLDKSLIWPHSVYASGVWLIPSSLGLAALSEDGVPVWEYLIPSVDQGYLRTAAPAVGVDGTIYVTLDQIDDEKSEPPERPPVLIALDHSGNLLWEYCKGYGPSQLQTSFVIIDGAGKLYIGGWSGIIILNRQGEELGLLSTAGKFMSNPEHLAIGPNRLLLVGYQSERISGYGL